MGLLVELSLEEDLEFLRSLEEGLWCGFLESVSLEE